MRRFAASPEIAFEREDVIKAMEYYLNSFAFNPISGPDVKVTDLQISKDAKYVLRMKITSRSK